LVIKAPFGAFLFSGQVKNTLEKLCLI